MKSGSSNVLSANLAGIRSRDGLKKSRFGSSRDHLTVASETFHTVSLVLQRHFREVLRYAALLTGRGGACEHAQARGDRGQRACRR
jgi:hypothetical protein